jgi:hypothetical protein
VSEPAVPVDANVVRPKIDELFLLEIKPHNNPDMHVFLIRRDGHGGSVYRPEFWVRAGALTRC